jgi:hypothetical protein
MNFLALLLLAVLPLQAESSRFTVMVNGERVGTEEFSIVPSGDGFLATGRTRLEFNGQEIDVRSRMELDSAFNPLSYEYRSGEQTLSVEVGDGIARIAYTVDGERTPNDVRFPEGAAIIDDNFFHHYMLLLYRLGTEGGAVPVFVPQQMTLGTLSVEPVGNGTFQLQSDNLELLATTDVLGRLVRLASADSSIVVQR